MSQQKFNETDRSRVTSELERHFQTRLFRTGPSKRVLYDERGRLFWIIGGYGNWHGVTDDMISTARSSVGSNDLLAIAKRYPTKIEIYTGALRLLADNRERLHRTRSGAYHFNLELLDRSLRIKEVNGLVLRRINILGEPAPRLPRAHNNECSDLTRFPAHTHPEY